MAQAKDSAQIEKLDDTNYAIWRFKIEMILERESLNNQITDPQPVPVTSEWKKRDQRARALINLTLSDSQIINIKHLSGAKETLDELQRIHERKNLSSKLFLLRKLYSIKLAEGGNMQTHITKILETLDKLRSIGEIISDAHISALLLCSIPKSYDTLVTALEARDEGDLTPTFIRSKLIDEYVRRNEGSNGSEQNDRAFQATKYKRQFSNYRNDNRSKFGQNSGRKPGKFCGYCRKSNHDKSECWLLANKNSNKHQNKYEPKSSYCRETQPRRSDANRTERSNNRDSGVENISSKMNEFAFSVNNTRGDTWVFDSGSSTHISNNKDLFIKIYDVNNSDVVIANGQTLTSYGRGEIHLETKTSDNKTRKIVLKDVLYVPDIQTNLLSVRQATKGGGEVIFGKNECSLVYKGEKCVQGVLRDNLYEVDFRKRVSDTGGRPAESAQTANAVETCENTNCILQWHKKLGHRNFDSINELATKNLAIGMKLDRCKHRLECEICFKSKMVNKPFPKRAEHRTTKTLDLVYSDLCGPMNTATIGGSRYLLTFTDDYSRFTTVYIITHKNQVFEKLKEFIASVQNKFGRTPHALRTDNGGEYANREVSAYLKSLGIKHQFTVPHCPQQNAVSERKNRSIVEMARCLLNQANLPYKFWGEAVNTANYLINRLPTKSHGRTPFELWEKFRPNLANLKPFGCKVYMYIDKSNRTKLDDRGKEGIFLGYADNPKGYRIYTGNNRVAISRTVKFLEYNFPKHEDEKNHELDKQNDSENNSEKPAEINLELNIDTQNVEVNKPVVDPPRRSNRSNRGVPPDRLVYLTDSREIREPENWDEIIKMENPRDKENWIQAAKDELRSLAENETWTLVDPPQGKPIIGSKWTFKVKYDSQGNVMRHKARLVAKGYSQKFGENYDETFAPVVTHTTIRTLLAVAAHKNLKVNHIDVKTAFLNGDLTEEIYMSQPEGFIAPGQSNRVCKLKKSIYGLKQAARAWSEKINNTLKQLKFQQSKTDTCLYTKVEKGNTIYLIIYVDDILIAGTDEQIDETIAQIAKFFKIKNLGTITNYLGMQIRKTREGYYAISQKNKIAEVVSKFNLNDAKPTYTPMEPGYVRDKASEGKMLPHNKQYRQAIGALLYIATVSRPDIMAPVGILSRHNENPRDKDWEQVKRIIKYLKTTIDIELILDPNPNATLSVYADADWAGDISDRKSTSGSVFKIGNSPIHWQSKKQSNVALSSAEAEFISAASAAQETLWLISLCEDLGIPQTMPIKLYEDNIPCIKMVESANYSAKSKHIQIKFHSIKQMKMDNLIDLHYCPSEEMTADLLTKPAHRPTLEKHREQLQLIPRQDFSH